MLRTHPAARLQRGLEDQARAETKGLWLPPDPKVEYARGRGQPSDPASRGAMETGLSVSQTIPWPGATAAGVRAGQRAAEALRAEGLATRWDLEVAARQAFDRLAASRALLEIDEKTEKDARSLRDLVTRRSALGETRESDRIKASVEWMRQRRLLEATRLDASSAEAIVRVLAVERLPQPLVLVTEPQREASRNATGAAGSSLLITAQATTKSMGVSVRASGRPAGDRRHFLFQLSPNCKTNGPRDGSELPSGGITRRDHAHHEGTVDPYGVGRRAALCRRRVG